MTNHTQEELNEILDDAGFRKDGVRQYAVSRLLEWHEQGVREAAKKLSKLMKTEDADCPLHHLKNVDCTVCASASAMNLVNCNNNDAIEDVLSTLTTKGAGE